MCWKYEKEYRQCFDHLMFDDVFFSATVPGLLSEYGVETVDRGRFRDMLYEMLDKMHEQGVIKPKEKG